jgi:DNA-binding SARP family transcriptional activator
MNTLVPSHKHDTIYVLHSGSREASEAVGRAKMSLFGSFHLEGPLGENLTPRGQKARALLALVALAKRGQRSRTWLCAKLWSDRPTEQAYASLRQALTEIRKALGAYSAALLHTDQFNISIDLNKVTVDAVELRQAIIENRRLRPIDLPDEEFLEGLNVGDEEFEDWLTIERSRWVDVRDELEQTVPTAWPTASAEVIRLAAAG